MRITALIAASAAALALAACQPAAEERTPLLLRPPTPPWPRLPRLLKKKPLTKSDIDTGPRALLNERVALTGGPFFFASPVRSAVCGNIDRPAGFPLCTKLGGRHPDSRDRTARSQRIKR
ncbi:hypothetical protein [Brevundimonas sp. Root1423]|uniref:hypothetical protein n=1 Tax=Brevundimonas sp. Root1423 TaxID=1736462 RepID=UPI00138ED80D|nr:hypothetical protein [Brevundimonas sp. Root1423]